MKSLLLVLLVLVSVGLVSIVNGAGECGNVPAERMAMILAPCASASQDANAAVSASCCSAVHTLGQTPRCLCAVMLSSPAKIAGVKPDVAITIPKRCRFADRPVGYKCGAYVLP